MVVIASLAAEQHGEGNSRRIRVQLGGSDRQQQAFDKHAHNTRRREYRARCGYR